MKNEIKTKSVPAPTVVRQHPLIESGLMSPMWPEENTSPAKREPGFVAPDFPDESAPAPAGVHTPELDQVRDHVARLHTLLVDPQPGLISWCEFYGAEMRGLVDCWQPGTAALLAERDGLRAALEAAQFHLGGTATASITDARRIIATALAKGGKPQPKLKTAAALRCQDLEGRTL